MKLALFLALAAVTVGTILAATRGERLVTEMVPMRDGVKLHTNIVFPREFKEGDKRTVIMDRSPYGGDGLELINDIFVPFGFITVGQDMRGTAMSEGNFTIWHSDADDSEDMGNWIVQQPWSDGKIFTFGASADGLAAFRTPDHEPSWLQGQYVIWSSSVGYDIIYPNGAYLAALADMWIRSTVPDQADDLLVTIKENEMKTDWWLPLELTNQYYKIHYPSAMWAGWYDIFLLGNLAAYEGYNTGATPAEQRYRSRLLVDPLGHCQDGAQYFTEDLIAGRTVLGVAQALELYGVRPVKRTNVQNVTFYVMSSNDDAGRNAGQYWSSLTKFPTPKMENWYLQADGSLTTSKPAVSHDTTTVAHSFKHDPSNPIPTQGGNNLQLPCGPLDQRVVDSRADVITFNTAPFAEAYPMTGPLLATLYVSSDAIDTDFMVRLSDVYPTGEVRLIQDNGIRMRWREGGLTPVFMTKDTVYKVEMTLWNTSYIMAPGHSLRVAISSSNAPRFDVNRNNGILLANQTPQDVNITAVNTVYHSADHASFISLPTVRQAQIPPYRGILKDVQESYPQLDWERIIREYPAKIQKMAFPY